MISLPHLSYPRILFYAVNGLGLGHVTRLLAIARAVRAQRPGAQILFVTTTEADSVIYREGFASVKVPSRTIIQQSQINPSTYNKLAHTIVVNTVAAFNPAILVADTFPAGASLELLPTLYWEMRRVFVYRAQQTEAASSTSFQNALSHYHLAIVPHNQGSEKMIAPETLRLAWTGPILIRDRSQALPRDESRQRLGLPLDAKLLYVTVGGGGDEEMAQSEGMIFNAARAAGWTTVAPNAPLTKLGETPAKPDFRVSYYPMAECLPAFDSAVSAGGYNSVNELLHFGIPSLLIPRVRGLDDQFRRASWAEQSGAAFIADLDNTQIESTLKKLRESTITEKMAESALGLVPSNGAGSAASEILALL